MLEDQLGLCKGWLLNGAWQVSCHISQWPCNMSHWYCRNLVHCAIAEHVATCVSCILAHCARHEEVFWQSFLEKQKKTAGKYCCLRFR